MLCPIRALNGAFRLLLWSLPGKMVLAFIPGKGGMTGIPSSLPSPEGPSDSAVADSLVRRVDLCLYLYAVR